jgi:hypothetical protein
MATCLAPGDGHVDAFDHLGEAVSFGTEIGAVTGVAHRIHAHADAVQPGIQQRFQYMGQAGVGVHVDGAMQGLFPDQADGRADNPGRHERVAFAALAEADHAVFTRVMCARATPAISSADGVKAMRFWLLVRCASC